MELDEHDDDIEVSNDTPTPTQPEENFKLCKLCRMPNKRYKGSSSKICIDCLSLREKKPRTEAQKEAFKKVADKRKQLIAEKNKQKNVAKKSNVNEVFEDEESEEDSPLEEVIIKKVKKPKAPAKKRVVVYEEESEDEEEDEEEYIEPPRKHRQAPVRQTPVRQTPVRQQPVRQAYIPVPVFRFY